MIELSFATGSGIRKVIIKDRKLSLITAELGFTPFTLDLDKLESKQNQKKMEKMKLTNEDKKTMQELAKLGNEKEIAKDIISDFQKSGWRLVKRK